MTVSAATPAQRWVLETATYVVNESITLTGSVAGRLLIATVVGRATAGAPLTPSGWTVVGALQGAIGGDSPQHVVLARVSAGAETVAFWDTTWDANKIVVVEEFDVTLASGLTVVGNFATSSGTSTNAVCTLQPTAVTPSDVLYHASVGIREVVTALSQIYGEYSAARQETNLLVSDGNTLNMATASSVVTASEEPLCEFSWTTAQRERGRVIGFAITTAPPAVTGTVASTMAPFVPAIAATHTPPAAFKGLLSSGLSTTSGTTVSLVVPALGIAIGDLVVVRVAADNLTNTTPTFTCTDSGGNTYVTLAQASQSNTAGVGATVGILATVATAAVAGGGSITVTLSGAVTAKAIVAESFTGFTTTVVASSVQTNNSTGSSSGAISVNNGDLVLGAVAVEDNSGLSRDNDTVGGAWSALEIAVASTGTAATSMTVGGQRKIANAASSQTHNVGWTPSTDWAAAIVALAPVAAPVTPVTGTVASTMAPFTSAIAATAITPVSGSVAATLAPFVPAISATALVNVAGAIASTMAPFVSAAAATVVQGITATVARTLGPFVPAITAAVTPNVPLVPVSRVVVVPVGFYDQTDVNLSSFASGNFVVAYLATRSSDERFNVPAGWLLVHTLGANTGTNSPAYRALVTIVPPGGLGTVNFWLNDNELDEPGQHDGTKVLVVEQYALPLRAGRTLAQLVVASVTNGDLPGGTADVTSLTIDVSPPGPLRLAWFAGMGVRQDITSPDGPGPGWNEWAQQGPVANMLWGLGGSTVVEAGAAPDAVFTWASANRARGGQFAVELEPVIATVAVREGGAWTQAVVLERQGGVWLTTEQVRDREGSSW